MIVYTVLKCKIFFPDDGLLKMTLTVKIKENNK